MLICCQPGNQIALSSTGLAVSALPIRRLGALQVGSSYCRERLGSLVAVRQAALQAFQALGEGVEIPTAQGAFYILYSLFAN